MAVQIIERQLPLLDEVVRVEQANVAVQRSVAADLAKARTQQRALRQELIDSRLKAQESELRLRNVLGRPARHAAAGTGDATHGGADRGRSRRSRARALDLRPDLIWQRIRTRIDEVDLLVAENRYRPQFDVQALSGQRLAGRPAECPGDDGPARLLRLGVRRHIHGSVGPQRRPRPVAGRPVATAARPGSCCARTCG